MEQWNIAIQKAFVVALGLKLLFPSPESFYLHDRSSLNVVAQYYFTFLSNLFKLMAPNACCLVADDAITGFSDNDRRHC